MEDRAVIQFITGNGEKRDIDVPLDISAAELIRALNAAFSLGISDDRLQEVFFKAENPIALVKGEKTLKELGVYNGTFIRCEV